MHQSLEAVIWSYLRSSAGGDFLNLEDNSAGRNVTEAEILCVYHLLRVESIALKDQANEGITDDVFLLQTPEDVVARIA